jgi:metal-dependent hydrolase (beta-lactamase superfamily II)
MHLSKFPLDAELEPLSKKLSEFNTKYYTCHCTGTDQYEFMKRYIDIDYLSTGTEREM